MITQPTRDRAISAALEKPSRSWWLVAFGTLLLAIFAASVFSPDMITGSNHEHLPLAGFTDWLWGAVGIGYLSFVRRESADASVAISVAILWIAVAAASIAAPSFVTGSDPTTIPIAAMIAPVVGAIGTGFLSLHALRRS